jgi:hypothetical protein
MRLLTLAIAIIITFGISLCSEHNAILEKFMNGPKKELFKVFHQISEKNYDLNSEEGIKRYKIFKDNLKYIKQENAKGNTYTLGITQFADLTHEEYKQTLKFDYTEFKKSFLGVEDQENSEDKKYKEEEFIPIDYTQHFGPVKN